MYEKSKELAGEIKEHEEKAREAAETLGKETDEINKDKFKME